MIFEEIRIWNLYSYYGEQVFRLPESTPDRPVVLIAGRNGYGKTSFINSVKLLFLGTADEIMKDVQVGRTLRPNTYLLGIDREWKGVFNRCARQEDARDTRYGVSIAWREEQGKVVAQRYWTLNGDDPEPHLHIETDFDTDFGRRIDDAEHAEEFLERRLPKSVVRFFFYDGEHVQQIAEANREGQLRQIERLLDIAALDTLHEYLNKAIYEWKRDGLAAEALAERAKLSADLQSESARSSALKAQIADADAEIDNLDREIRRQERQADALRAKSLQRDEPRLRERLRLAKDGYETACRKVTDSLPAAAPLWAVPQLVAAVGQAISEATANPGHLLSQEIAGILGRLPEQLLDSPPHPSPVLTDGQKAHLRRKLENIGRVFTDSPTGGFFSLSAAETLDLKRRVDYFHQADDLRRRIADDLREASRLRREMNDAQAALDSLSNISPEEQRQFRERQQAIAEAKGRRDGFVSGKGRVEGELKVAESAIKKLENDIAHAEVDLAKKSINGRRIERARQAQRLFETYKQRLKATLREQIEAAINRRFKTLMTSHGLVANIAVDEEFALTYRDAAGQEVGMANMSAGMKQLAAHALQWALKDVTGIHAPIILDSPLARLDRGHQGNILVLFYPEVGDQVIILPTDSEIDREKYLLLKPHIAAEFRLDNTSGDHTKVRAGVPMYDLEAA